MNATKLKTFQNVEPVLHCLERFAAIQAKNVENGLQPTVWRTQLANLEADESSHVRGNKCVIPLFCAKISHDSARLIQKSPNCIRLDLGRGKPKTSAQKIPEDNNNSMIIRKKTKSNTQYFVPCCIRTERSIFALVQNFFFNDNLEKREKKNQIHCADTDETELNCCIGTTNIVFLLIDRSQIDTQNRELKIGLVSSC